MWFLLHSSIFIGKDQTPVYSISFGKQSNTELHPHLDCDLEEVVRVVHINFL